MTAIKEFKKYTFNVLNKVWDNGCEDIVKAGEKVADSLENDGVIHTFGTGHSHLIAEEIFYRAGGLAPVNAMLEPSLTGHQHVTKSEYTERMEGWGEIILDYHNPQKNDILIVISNSGRNAAPVEVAREGQKRDLPVIAIVSRNYCENIPSRHTSGKKLIDYADIIIDNQTELGDADVNLEGLDVPVGPTSNISAMFIIHSIVITAIEELLERDIEPPVFLSGNLDRGREHNDKLIEKYKDRINSW